ncbi:MAG: zinc-binding dehydrogenase [Nitriliruptorales bacterium]|nr:zinc-binding dehydrogenase [Nitriliruptorales bacterium]
MRAVQINNTGGPGQMRVADVATPEPTEGEVLVRLEAAGVNFIDVYYRLGRYPLALPATLGVEASGTVESVGVGVTDFVRGDRVAYAMVPGAYADAAVVPAGRLVPVPDGLEATKAAAVLLQGMTAHFLATSTVPLAEGDRVLIHAAAGGVGLLLTQVAKRCGATVYATVSTDEKAELARAAGADEVIIYSREPFTDAVTSLTDGSGVDVVYDGVGKDTFDDGLASLRPRGHMVLYGQASGPVPPVDPQRLNTGGSLYLTRPTLAHYVAGRDELLQRAGDVLRWVRDGELDVRIGETHPLEDAAVAHERLEARQTTGKVLLVP